jgi:hypothetical protein
MKKSSQTKQRKLYFAGMFLIFFITITTVLEAKEPSIQIQQKTVQDTTRQKKSLKLLLEEIEVQGWIEKPQMVYVVPGINPEVDDIVLDRSFIDEILKPLDKDKFEKQRLLLSKKVVIPW